jgi:hypothetical protein
VRPFNSWVDAMAVANAAAQATGYRYEVYRDRIALNTWRVSRVVPA